ncbi:MAG: S-layer homology domain-containing protein [Clostridia bacterium]|nr:S-layer homology domain-containing protein [Clostridia bacterium]
MKKIVRNIIAIILALVMVSSTFVCFADGLNEDAVNAHRGQYKNYVLLGDSVASGYRDVMSENDDLYNKTYGETAYCRVPGSYADVLANAIIEDKSMTAFAGPGFRTIEIRYMLEDDFDEADDYMFHPAQMDTVGDAGSEEYRTAYKKAVKEADLITLGVGGNDWGAYLGWVIADVFEEENVADKYKKELVKILESMEMGTEMVESLVDLAHVAGALPELATTIPAALSYGLGKFYSNWDIMIQDIYDLNPDVTLMVLGMSDNGLKGNYFDYDGVAGGPVNAEQTEQNELVTIIVDFIMGVGNRPMIEGAKKFGYTYVDTAGTTYVESHPDAAGHVHIANKIIEALPDRDIFETVNDVKPGYKYYNDVEYVLKNDLMALESEGKFNPEAPVTEGKMNFAFNKINGTDNATDSTENASATDFALKVLKGASQKGFIGMIKCVVLAFNIISENSDNAVTRGEAANYLRRFCEI